MSDIIYGKSQPSEEDNKKKKRKKFLLLFFGLFAMVAVTALSVTVGVLASRNGKIDSDIDVDYTSKEVAVWVDAGIRHGEIGEYTAFSGGENGVIKFDGTETTASGTLVCPENKVVLTNVTNNTSATFMYHFVNKGDGEIRATLAVPTGTNVNVEYSADGTTWSETNFGLTIAGGSGNEATYYIKVSIGNVAFDASLAGSFAWTLENTTV